MASVTLPPEADAVIRNAKQALIPRNLARGFTGRRVRENGVEMVRVRNTSPIHISYGRELPGDWSVHMEWLFRRVPGGPHVLWRSSIGLSVADVALAPDDAPICLVRYDVDNGRQGPLLAPLGRHINVLQPGDLGDRVHYPTFGGSTNPWDVDEILAFFESSSFVEDVKGRIQ